MAVIRLDCQYSYFPGHQAWDLVWVLVNQIIFHCKDGSKCFLMSLIYIHCKDWRKGEESVCGVFLVPNKDQNCVKNQAEC